jgi:cell wall-associated NlpC family hydrolase
MLKWHKKLAMLVILGLLISAVPALAALSTIQIVNPGIGAEVASTAISLSGSPYVFGGTTPDGFDCSGFVQYVNAQWGIALPRTVRSQSGVGATVSRENLQPGDIVFFKSDTSSTPSLDGVYIGADQFMASTGTTDGVGQIDLNGSYYQRNFLYGKRVTGSATYLGDVIARDAQQYLGVPYLFGGTTTAGMDASGLVQTVYKAKGYTLPRTMKYQFTVGLKVTRSQLNPGDLVFFGSGTTPSLVGIYVGSNSFVASGINGKVSLVTTMGSGYYYNSFIGGRRIVDVLNRDTVTLPDFPPEPPEQTASEKAQIAIAYAESKLGAPYVFGAAGPDSFDCSGLTKVAYAQAGIYLPHSSASQATYGVHVDRSNLQPGDLIIFVDTYKAGISHVGIYVGNDTIINALPNGGVQYTKITTTYWSTRYYDARRVTGY